VALLAGIARPERFRATAQSLGARVVEQALFPDHHAFAAGELSSIEARARAKGAQVLTTEKDAVRLPPGFPAWVVAIDLEITEGEAALASTVERR
jgi:tetraacyldisaccharide 4'-kinase